LVDIIRYFPRNCIKEVSPFKSFRGNLEKLRIYLRDLSSGKRPLPLTRQKTWKARAAKLTKTPLARLAMGLAVKLTVPRQRVGVALVTLNEADEVFMLRHVFHAYYEWGLPGGWLKKNEAPEVGVLRELKEETGLTAVLGPVVSVLHNLTPPHIGIAYLGQLNGDSVTLSHEIIEARWFSLDNLPAPLTSHTQQVINAAIQAHQQN
jgi:ADP-ribose pyrophosphatase YjhB (NUDIX family)